MKTAVVILSLALVFLAVLQESTARYPGEVEVKGTNSKSSSDIESSSSDEKNESVKVGGLKYEKGSKKNEYSEDHDTASATEKEETVNDDFGNIRKVKSKSKKTSSEDVDGESSSTYTKVSC